MTPPKRQPAHGHMRAARPRRRSDGARYAAAAQLQVPVEGAGVATEQQRADAGAAQAQLDVLGRELVQGGRAAGRQLHRAHQRLAVDAVDAAVGPPAGLLALVHQPHDLLQLQRVAGLAQPQLLVERVQLLQVGADRRRDLLEELALLRRQHQLLGTQLGRQRQVAPQVGPLGHARGRLAPAVLSSACSSAWRCSAAMSRSNWPTSRTSRCTSISIFLRGPQLSISTLRAATAQPTATPICTVSARISQFDACSMTTWLAPMTQFSAPATVIVPSRVCSTALDATPATLMSPAALLTVPPTRLRPRVTAPPRELILPYTSPCTVMSPPLTSRSSCTSPNSP